MTKPSTRPRIIRLVVTSDLPRIIGGQIISPSSFENIAPVRDQLPR